MIMLEKLSENIFDKLTIDLLRNQVLKNAYGNSDTVIARLDPRLLILWYLFFGVVPWFLQDVRVLLGLFLFLLITASLAKIAPLVLFLFGIGVFTQTGYLLLVSLLFGGNGETVVALLVMTLKVAAVSLASITVFSGLEPDRLASGLEWFGCPERLSFSISFAYRLLPTLMEEFQSILLSYRLRGNPPAADSLKGKIRWLIYQVKIIMLAFYPLMLNMAKKSRTTVEALELRGYRYASQNKKVKRMRLSSLRLGRADGVFLAVSVVWTAAAFLLPGMFA